MDVSVYKPVSVCVCEQMCIQACVGANVSVSVCADRNRQRQPVG